MCRRVEEWRWPLRSRLGTYYAGNVGHLLSSASNMIRRARGRFSSRESPIDQLFPIQVSLQQTRWVAHSPTVTLDYILRNNFKVHVTENEKSRPQ